VALERIAVQAQVATNNRNTEAYDFMPLKLVISNQTEAC
jgi:hypothetical protein